LTSHCSFDVSIQEHVHKLLWPMHILTLFAVVAFCDVLEYMYMHTQ